MCNRISSRDPISLSQSLCINAAEERQAANALDSKTNSPLELLARSDRRVVLTLMSSFQQIDVDWQDAVKGTDLAEKAWPAV